MINSIDSNQKLVDFIDLNHRFVHLAHEIDWKGLQEQFSHLYNQETGRKPLELRLVLGVMMLKYLYNLSDAETIALWLENPYWQYFCGCEYFQKTEPMDSSSMTTWRKRLKDSGAEKVLKESIKLGLKTKTVKASSFKKVIFDTTVQPKNIAYPTDSKLLHRGLEKMVKLSKAEGVRLKQTFKKSAKSSLIKAGRYAHARQMKRAKNEVRKLRVFTGRVVRDFKRKATAQVLEKAHVKELLETVERVIEQKRQDSKKVYSIHEKDVECIAKGKARQKYEFGSKVSLGCTIKEGFIVEVQSLDENSYDGHTLVDAVKRAEENTGTKIEAVVVDKGYRGHAVQEKKVYISGTEKKLTKAERQLLNRRQVIEPVIGHTKQDSKLGRNYLKGKEGDKFNSIFSAIGKNIRSVLNTISERLNTCRSCSV